MVRYHLKVNVSPPYINEALPKCHGLTSVMTEIIVNTYHFTINTMCHFRKTKNFEHSELVQIEKYSQGHESTTRVYIVQCPMTVGSE